MLQCAEQAAVVLGKGKQAMHTNFFVVRERISLENLWNTIFFSHEKVKIWDKSNLVLQAPQKIYYSAIFPIIRKQRAVVGREREKVTTLLRKQINGSMNQENVRDFFKGKSFERKDKLKVHNSSASVLKIHKTFWVCHLKKELLCRQKRDL